MAVTDFTNLLGLSLPTTGDLVDIWGDVVNDTITSLIDDAIAGGVVLGTDADVVLSSTNGVPNQARNAIIIWTASNAVVRNVTVPARSKVYVVVNRGTGDIRIRGVGPTAGVVVAHGTSAVVAWDGLDFVAISGGGGGGGAVTDLTPGTLTANRYLRINGAGTAIIGVDYPQKRFITASFPGNLAAVVGSTRWYPDKNITLQNVHVSVGTPPTGAPAVFNVRKNGAALFSSPKPTIAVSQNVSATNALTTTLTPSDYLTLDVETPSGAANAVIRVDYLEP